MAKLKNQAAQLGMGTPVAGLKAVGSGVRQRARKVVGVKPSKELLVKGDVA